MKSKARNIAEKFFTFQVIRRIIRCILWLMDMLGRAWSFARVRAIISVPAGSSCHWRTVYKYPSNIHISGPIMINPDCVLGAKALICIGSGVRLSQGVHIETASLDLNSGLPYKHIAKPIFIEDGVWLGAHVIVLGGVRIGANAIIGAGVVVSKDVPAGAIIVGAGTRTIERKATYSQ
ncbi:maltose O-acetyltransferase [Pseudomonas lini]|uniref:acyltransferase n=1 Tax=Pseudomonas lini TaxID=163011 RepID=UPI0027894612|nr:maltose O-acetyltransferase [Pseudomonas lini]